jgi:hypothetical protein
MTDVTEAAMPEGGRRCNSEGGGAGGAGGCWREERVKVTRAIAPGDHALCLKVLHRETKRIKLNGTVIISGETTNGN